MSCSVAISNSPVFSPSRSMVSSSIFCNKTSLLSPSSSPAPSTTFRLRLPQKSPVDLSSSSSSASSIVSKRKRPGRLDIPVQNFEFCSPVTPSIGREVLEEERDGYAVYCKRGRRDALEDRYSAAVDLQAHSKQALFGIYDGHGGPKAAIFAAENLEKNILDEVVRRDDGEVEEAIKHGYKRTDSDLLKEDIWGGSCCVTALIRKGNLVVSNAGDCRAVLSRGGVAEALSSDHRPSRKDEKDRIENSGGYVDLHRGIWRIQGTLAVSRGLGDGHLKQWVISEPETTTLRLEPQQDFLLLASDGLWDKVNNQEAVDIAHSLCVGVSKPEPLKACKMLADLSASRGSHDDISVMLIQLGNYA